MPSWPSCGASTRRLRTPRLPEPARMPSEFLSRNVPVFGRRVHRVGLSASFGLDEAGIEAALERGLEYVFWNPTAYRLTRVLRRLGSRRERLVIATGPTLGFFPG